MKIVLRMLGLTLAILLADGNARADFIVAATASSNLANTSTFGSLDLTTGQFRSVATMSVTVQGLTSDPNGSLYASDSSGFLDTVSSGGVATRFGTSTAPVPPGGAQIGYFGLAYAGASGFFASNFNGTSPVLDQISSNGNSVSAVGTLTSGVVTGFGTGSLAFGPNGSLYFVANDASGSAFLYGVNTSTGVATEIGTGLGTFLQDSLTLVTVGGQLYGIDTFEPSGSGPINIYTINTTTGVATATGVVVTGLAAGFTLDTAAAVPEPSSLALCGVAGAIGLAVARVRRKWAA